MALELNVEALINTTIALMTWWYCQRNDNLLAESRRKLEQAKRRLNTHEGLLEAVHLLEEINQKWLIPQMELQKSSN